LSGREAAAPPRALARAGFHHRLGQVLPAERLVEIPGELFRQLAGARVESVLVLPGVARVENFAGNARAGKRHLDVKQRVGGVFRPVKRAVQDGGDDGAGQVDVHPLADPVRPPAPAGVDQVHAGAVLAHFLAQERSVGVGVAGHERRAEKPGEGGDGFGDAGLGAGQLARVAHQEPEHGLVLVQPGHRRQHPVGVGRQEGDGAGMRSDGRLLDPGQEGERVGAARIFGQPLVMEVEAAGRVHHGVFHDGAVFQVGRLVHDGVVDLRLLGRVEVDELGVAAELEVGDAGVVPAVLVVAEQGAVGVGGEGGLARPGKPQEQGRGAVLALVGRGVQGQDADAGQQVVHDGENQLLAAAHVGRADDDAQAVHEIDGHDQVGGAPVRQRADPAGVAFPVQPVHGEGHQGEGPVGEDAAVQVGRHRPEHGFAKQDGQGVVGDRPHRQGIGAVGAYHAVEHVQLLLAPGQFQGVRQDQVERRRIQGEVVRRVPVDVRHDLRAADDDRVLGAAARRVHRRPGGQGAVPADEGRAAGDGMLDEQLPRGVDVHVGPVLQDRVQAGHEFHRYSPCSVLVFLHLGCKKRQCMPESAQIQSESLPT